MQKHKQAFTLVELIVVLTIIAILGTIAFISLQGYNKDARDSVRVSDMSEMKSSLELFHLNAGKYPETTNGVQITYSGTLNAWTQGIFGDDTFLNIEKLDKIPRDPLTEKEYVYSVTNNKQEYQLVGIMEGDEVSFLGNQTNAATKTAIVKVTGNYNGKILKVVDGTTTYILAVPSIITASGFTLESIAGQNDFVYNGYKNLPASYLGSSYEILGDDGITFMHDSDLLLFTGNLKDLSDTTSTGVLARLNLITKLQSAYTGTVLSNIGEISEILNVEEGNVDKLASTIVSNNLGGSLVVSINSGLGESSTIDTELITEEICTDAGWFWITPEEDMYIGTSRGNGFCISPAVLYIGDVADKGISWNGWGYRSDLSQCNGWEADPINDDGSIKDNQGQTRILQVANGSSLPQDYICKELGTAIGNITLSDNTDSTNSSDDTLENRMRWLVKNKQNRTEFENIDWINAGTLLRNNIVPSLFLADCIDGIRNLGTGNDMNYVHKDDSTDNVTYIEYSENVTVAMSTVGLFDNITYQNRQKYLTAWTQNSGSHLPSAFSYITNGSSGGCDTGECVNLIQAGKGEWEQACDSGKITDGINKDISLAAVGKGNGSYFGSESRRNSNCIATGGGYTGSDRGVESARFVVRP